MQVSGAVRGRVHPAWVVAAVAFVALLCAAGFRAAPGVLLVPLQHEFGWSRAVLSTAVGINLVLFGLVSPFAAALMDRFGIRRVTASALVLIAAGSALPVLMTQSWQLMLTWGVLIGTGTGAMALVFAATIANRWFVRHRGLVMGILTAGNATGQLIFLPVLATVTDHTGWRTASLVIALAALGVVPLALRFLRDHPGDRGVRPYGAGESLSAEPAGSTPQPQARPGGAAKQALAGLRMASRTRTFWALAVGFAICGATTHGLIGTHFIPAAHDHGMHQTTAAGLLAVVGIFDIVGTIASGYLTDRIDPRILLGAYYFLRGVGLALLPGLLADSVQPSMIAFIVVYGLDWVATVPPTAALCREAFGEAGTIVFGWVFAAHQIGAAIASVTAGAIRDATGEYTGAWFSAAALCTVAAVISWSIRRTGQSITPSSSREAVRQGGPK